MNDFVKWEIELNPNSTLTEDGTELDDPYGDDDYLTPYPPRYADELDEIEDNEMYYFDRDDDPTDYFMWMDED